MCSSQPKRCTEYRRNYALSRVWNVNLRVLFSVVHVNCLSFVCSSNSCIKDTLICKYNCHLTMLIFKALCERSLLFAAVIVNRASRQVLEPSTALCWREESEGAMDFVWEFACVCFAGRVSNGAPEHPAKGWGLLRYAEWKSGKRPFLHVCAAAGRNPENIAQECEMEGSHR